MTSGKISPKTKDRFSKAMRGVIKGLSRKITIYRQPVKSECPNCYYDKLTDSSTGKGKWSALEAQTKQTEWALAGNSTIKYKFFKVGRCPICTGRGYLETQRKAYADCLVTWNPNDKNKMIYTPAGIEGSTIVELKTDPKHFDTFRSCKEISVDGVACRLSKPPVLRGLGNQTVLIVTAFTTDKARIDSSEIIKDYTS